MKPGQEDKSSNKISKKRSLKRKILSDTAERNGKRRKVLKEEQGIDGLDWKVVERPSTAGIDEAGGMLLLEEVDNVEVYYEDTPQGRVAKFRQIINVTEDLSKETTEDVSKSTDDEEEPVNGIPIEEESFDEGQLPEWSGLGLLPTILRRICNQGFVSPTPIQKSTLPLASSGRDVIGISQTGSGKTLAFALPILNYTLSNGHPSRTHKRSLKALILAPTRELALQVSAHINACSPQRSEEQIKAHGPPRISIATIVGGMSSQKQLRLLEKGVDIIVATPGRLWELIGEDDQLAEQVRHIRFLVLDEADRMIENGHFAELDKIIRLTIRPEESDEGEANDQNNGQKEDQLQTFIFSATMSKDLQHNLKRVRRARTKHAIGTTIDDLIAKLDFRDPDPAVVDLSPKDGLVPSLQESKVECLLIDKDVYLYYFLLRYPGRSLVFMSAIDGIRRLVPLLELLEIKVWPLHSQMEQKQRLKNLDRFKSNAKCVLLATDVAARGLDVPFVDHVIHYQVPRSADIYIHRNGRTARAERPGFGLLLCAPDERKLARSLFSNLKRSEDDIPDLPVERDLLDRLKERVQLAREIDKIQHGFTKEKHDDNWLKITAEALELELSDDDDRFSKRSKGKKDNHVQVKAMKSQLHELISEPLLVRGASRKFITSGSRPIVEDLLRGQSHDAFLGLKVVAAQDDVVERKKIKKKSKGAKTLKNAS